MRQSRPDQLARRACRVLVIFVAAPPAPSRRRSSQPSEHRRVHVAVRLPPVGRTRLTGDDPRFSLGHALGRRLRFRRLRQRPPDVPGRLPGGARQRVPAVRSEPGQLHVSRRRRRCGMRSTECALVFHHVSRHLSDRPKRDAVAWNALDRADRCSGSSARGDHRRRHGRRRPGRRARVRRLHLAGATSTSWCAVRSRRASAFYGRGFGETYRRRRGRSAGRGQQRGGRIEAGVRLQGRGRRARPVRRLRTDDRRRSARPAARHVGVRRVSADVNVTDRGPRRP